MKVEDVFRLGKYSSSSCGPHPVLIKLSSAWDRRIILLHKRNLKGFRIPRLFLREDVHPEHKLRKRGALVQNKGSPIALPTSPTHQAPCLILYSGKLSREKTNEALKREI